ncbi:uncharacterized protein LOC131639659 [Vicia villosa]|uniref:uncharacterized protein LOC131639659 n=1 Tax=Vicia villosa TaxID=3911 RepID=UPI00273C22FB|nr:uncharacterized protein LOC131639659 [Vicia villosa]
MTCSEEKKVLLGTHMLEEEAEDWWNNTSQRFVEEEVVVTWVVFKEAFLEKYFPEDERGKKEIEFLELKQENSSVAVYASRFEQLVKYCPNYNTTDLRARSDFYRNKNDKKGKGQFRGKPYETPADKGKQKAGYGNKPRGGGNQSSPRCFNCGEVGHRSFECKKEKAKCLKCGKEGHTASNCKQKQVTCYNCGEVGHYSMSCPKPKQAPAGGKVFALAGGDMVIDTPSSDSITTSLVCLSCPLTIYGREFVMDLICLPMKDVDVILGMNWLVYNRVNIDCYHKLVRFPFLDGDGESYVLSTKELKRLLADEAHLFGLFASLTVEDRAAVEDFSVVCEFPEVFPEDFYDVPPKREVEFSIDLVPGTKPVSMPPYRISASELVELKK